MYGFYALDPEGTQIEHNVAVNVSDVFVVRYVRAMEHDMLLARSRETGRAVLRGCVPIVCLRKGRPIPLTAIPYGTDDWKRLYRGRAAVEREFGRLKHDYGLAPLRVRGLTRVQLHADLTILARLAQALSRARAAPLAA